MLNAVKSQILSDTYVYGATWDGELLLQGRLTAGSVFSLAREEKRYRSQREKALKVKRSRAVGGFELAMQLVSTKTELETSAPLIIEAWMNYAAHTKIYSQLNQYRHKEGVHIVILGWYLKDGSLKLKTEIALNEHRLTPEQIKHVAYCGLEKAYAEAPDSMPEGYKPLPKPLLTKNL